MLVSVYFNTKRTLANGLAMSGSSVGQFVLPPFLEYLVEHYGLSGCLMIVSYLCQKGLLLILPCMPCRCNNRSSKLCSITICGIFFLLDN